MTNSSLPASESLARSLKRLNELLKTGTLPDGFETRISFEQVDPRKTEFESLSEALEC